MSRGGYLDPKKVALQNRPKACVKPRRGKGRSVPKLLSVQGWHQDGPPGSGERGTQLVVEVLPASGVD